MTATPEIASGLEGVVAFATEIAEPDREGGALRYRGVDVEELVGRVLFEQVWGLLVDGALEPGLAPAEAPPAVRTTGDVRADLQAALAQLSPQLGLKPLIDLDPDQARADLARVSDSALDIVAEAARTGDGAGAGTAAGGAAPGSARGGDPVRASTLAERFLIRWRGEADPVHARAIDAYWSTAAEHGVNASTFTARIVASTGADAAAALSAAVGALSGPLHGGAPARVLQMLEEVERAGDATRYVQGVLDRGERLMGFGHRVYRAEDPRARVLRRAARELRSPRLGTAEALERAALDELAARKPDRVLATNVEFWSAVVLDHAQVPPHLFVPLFACSRTAGWSAHVLEQKRSGRLIRPTAAYVGEGPRSLG
jgi:citrate synthase